MTLPTTPDRKLPPQQPAGTLIMLRTSSSSPASAARVPMTPRPADAGQPADPGTPPNAASQTDVAHRSSSPGAPMAGRTASPTRVQAAAASSVDEQRAQAHAALMVVPGDPPLTREAVAAVLARITDPALLEWAKGAARVCDFYRDLCSYTNRSSTMTDADLTHMGVQNALEQLQECHRLAGNMEAALPRLGADSAALGPLLHQMMLGATTPVRDFAGRLMDHTRAAMRDEARAKPLALLYSDEPSYHSALQLRAAGASLERVMYGLEIIKAALPIYERARSSASACPAAQEDSGHEYKDKLEKATLAVDYLKQKYKAWRTEPGSQTMHIDLMHRIDEAYKAGPTEEDQATLDTGRNILTGLRQSVNLLDNVDKDDSNPGQNKISLLKLFGELKKFADSLNEFKNIQRGDSTGDEYSTALNTPGAAGIAKDIRVHATHGLFKMSKALSKSFLDLADDYSRLVNIYLESQDIGSPRELDGLGCAVNLLKSEMEFAHASFKLTSNAADGNPAFLAAAKSLRKEIESKETTIKQGEKLVLERTLRKNMAARQGS